MRKKKTLKQMTLEELKAAFDASILDIDRPHPHVDLGAIADYQSALLKEIARRADTSVDVAGNPLNGVLTQAEQPGRKREKVGGIEV